MEKREKIETAALYSSWCPGLTYDQSRTLEEFLTKTTNSSELKKVNEIVKKSEPYVWYSFIEWANLKNENKPQASSKIYWEGEENLERIKREDLKSFLEEKKIDKAKKEYVLSFISGNYFYPFHNFLILNSFIPDETNLENRDKCKVSLGRIEEVGEAILRVAYSKLAHKERKLSLSPNSKTLIKKGFVEKVHKEDLVSFHYGIARKIVNQEEKRNLTWSTQKAVELFNEQQK